MDDLTRLLNEAAHEPEPPVLDLKSIKRHGRTRRRNRKIITTLSSVGIVVAGILVYNAVTPVPLEPSQNLEAHFSVLQREQDSSDRRLSHPDFDPGAVREIARDPNFLYSLATRRGEFCIRQVLAISPSEGNHVCASPEEVLENGVFAVSQVFTTAVEDAQTHYHTLVIAVVDGFTHIQTGDSIYEVVDNVVVFNAEPFPRNARLIGPNGDRDIALPDMPTPPPGDWVKTGFGSR